MDEQNTPIGNYEQGIETMKKLWGEKLTEDMRALWKQAHPDVEKYITAFAVGEIWSRPGLDLKTRSLVSLSAAIALERDGQIRLHTQGALNSGATSEEIMETWIKWPWRHTIFHPTFLRNPCSKFDAIAGRI